MISFTEVSVQQITSLDNAFQDKSVVAEHLHEVQQLMSVAHRHSVGEFVSVELILGPTHYVKHQKKDYDQHHFRVRFLLVLA